jgi:hypothetical protein
LIELLTLSIVAITITSGWGTEAPREATIAFGMWLFGLLVGAYLANRHIKKPMINRHKLEDQRHKEIMDSHRAIHDKLDI